MKQALAIVGMLFSGAVVCGQLDNIGINLPVLVAGLIGFAICGAVILECGRK